MFAVAGRMAGIVSETVPGLLLFDHLVGDFSPS
jgi:hypothetical protein